ncbi:hypothetical protein C8Q70DRAFT_21268 [Cubamyces menziesii]|nr:hypothetical protein C8Q70DRAFT_21268 [Cubamyces menziesii]
MGHHHHMAAPSSFCFHRCCRTLFASSLLFLPRLRTQYPALYTTHSHSHLHPHVASLPDIARSQSFCVLAPQPHLIPPTLTGHHHPRAPPVSPHIQTRTPRI